MKIAILGSGIVGTAQGQGLMQMGHDVIFYDVKSLKEMNNCHITNKIDEAINFADISYICVPTPYNNGIDLSYVKDVCESMVDVLREKDSWHLIVVKSTVLPLTCETVVIPILNNIGKDYGLCMNPEFLTEINATWTDDLRFKRDFWCKERIVIGEKDKKSGDVLEQLYKPIGAPIFRVDLKTAEMMKYATNMMLATKISYWNEIFLVCKELGIDSNLVANVTSQDTRIGRYGTIHGMAYGGKCLSKDIKAFTSKFCKYTSGMLTGYDKCPSVLNEVDAVNDFMSSEYGVRE